MKETSQVTGAAFRVFEHVNAPKAELYRTVMQVFVDHKRRFLIHLRPEDVLHELAGAVPGGLPEVENALNALAGWGNLRADPDTSRVSSVEDFYRRRLLYQLSQEGEAAERALEVFEGELGRRGELQSVALQDIRVRLHALHDLLGAGDPDPAVAHSLLLELSGRLESLAANASAFMSGLQRVIDLQDLDEEAFFAYKDRLIAYLERFVADLVQKSFDIRRTLIGFTDPALIALLLVAATREAGDAVPDEGERDPVQIRLEQWQARWSGLVQWFVGSRARPSQSELLRRRASRAIPDLLAAIRLLQERRTGRSDRSADYRTLALWFAQADEPGAHRLWRAAFGVGSSRHLAGLSGTEGAAATPSGTPWPQAPGVEIAARLRETGHYQRRGKAARVADRSEDRARLAARVAAEREQTERARRRIATGEPIRLSALGAPEGLDSGEFRFFLRLLGDALAAGPDAEDGSCRATTSDGAFDVVLTPITGAGLIGVRSADGTVWAPDHTITVVDRSRPPSPSPELVHSGTGAS